MVMDWDARYIGSDTGSAADFHLLLHGSRSSAGTLVRDKPCALRQRDILCRLQRLGIDNA
jgi:hypothetical protein